MITFDEGLAREVGWYAVKNDVYYGPYVEEYEAELQLRSLRIQELEGILKRIIERPMRCGPGHASSWYVGYDDSIIVAQNIAMQAFSMFEE